MPLPFEGGMPNNLFNFGGRPFEGGGFLGGGSFGKPKQPQHGAMGGPIGGFGGFGQFHWGQPNQSQPQQQPGFDPRGGIQPQFGGMQNALAQWGSGHNPDPRLAQFNQYQY